MGAVAFLAFFILDALTAGLPPAPTDTAGRVLFIACSLVTIYAILGVHEVGHILASRLVGLRMHSLTVGPVTFRREAGRRRMRLHLNLSLFRGVVRFQVDPGERRRRRLAVVSAGGPVISLIIGLLAMLFLLKNPPDEWQMHREAGVLLARQLALLASGSIAVGLANLIPLRFAGGLSDGARLLQLLRD